MTEVVSPPHILPNNRFCVSRKMNNNRIWNKICMSEPLHNFHFLASASFKQTDIVLADKLYANAFVLM